MLARFSSTLARMVPATLFILAACSDTNGTPADAGSSGGLPAHCKNGTGNLALEKKASLQVFDLLHTKVLAPAEEVPVSASSISAGKSVDIGVRLTNTASLSVARELVIKSAKITDTSTGTTGASAFACFVERSDGTQAPCEGFKFASVTPEGFDPACVSDKAAGHGTSAKLVVRFTKPADNVGRSATLSVVVEGDDKFKDDKPFDVKLRTIAGLPKLSVNPTQLDFGTIAVGEPQEPEQVSVSNVGDADLEVTAIEVALKDAKAFDIDIDGQVYKGGKTHTLAKPIVLAKNKSRAVLVSFNPIDGNGHISELVFHSNDAAKTAKVKLIANQDVPCLKVSPGAMNFGYVALGTKAPKKLCLTSCGTSPVEVADLKIGDTSGVFAIDASTLGVKLGGKPIGKGNPLQLDVNEEVCFDVTCEPSSENKDASGQPQPFKGSLTLDDNTIVAAKSVKLECFGTSKSCPTAVIDIPQGQQIVPQSPLTLDSNKSFGAAGTLKTVEKRKWTVVKKPPGAEGQSFHPNDTAAKVQFGALSKSKAGKMEVLVNVAGEYVFALKVVDTAGTEGCSIAEAQVLVIPEESIHVELLWDTPGDQDKTDTDSKDGADLDLHFAHPNAMLSKTCNPKNPEMCDGKACLCQPDLDLDGKSDPFFHGLYDCYWFNSSPNWGAANPDDNPGLDLDDTNGWGPENLNLLTPENQKYTVGVHSWDDHGFGDSVATVNIYILGSLKGTYTRPMTMCDMWWVKLIEWPSGALLDVPGATDAKGKVTPKYKHSVMSALSAGCK